MFDDDCRFQKRLQLNLLQLVDAVSIQFKAAQGSRPAVASQTHVAETTNANDDGVSSSGPSIAVSHSATRKKRSSFTDMPKI